MKILHLSTTTSGGAGIAARRLNKSLNYIGEKSILVTSSKDGSDVLENERILKRSLIRKLLSKSLTVSQSYLMQRSSNLVTPLSINTISIKEIRDVSPDVIHIHNFYNLLNPNGFKAILDINVPVFITLHDERILTGGCHCTLDCQKFQNVCASCPQTKIIFQNSVTNNQLRMRKILSNQEKVTLVCPSEWIYKQAQLSNLTRNLDARVIHNPIDLNWLEDASLNNRNLSIRESYVITFVAQDLNNPYKGLDTILRCIEENKELFKKEKIAFRFVGSGRKIAIGEVNIEQILPIGNEEMRKIYSESDLLLVPSLSDNSPNVIFEALMCGTPFICSNRAGLPEIANKTGMLTFNYGDTTALLEAILRQKMRTNNPENLRDFAKSLVGPKTVATQMRDLYYEKLTVAS